MNLDVVQSGGYVLGFRIDLWLNEPLCYTERWVRAGVPD